MDAAIYFLFGLLLVSAAFSEAFTGDYGLEHVFPSRFQNEYLYDKYYREELVPNLTCKGRGNCRGLHRSHDPCDSIISRTNWQARYTRHADYMVNPVSIVFIHHTGMERCFTTSQCVQAMRKVQEFHMDVKKWDDIGYSFVVGEDGYAYEARGYSRVGAHTLGWNNVSISIGVMGNFSDTLPNGPALEAINNVIECGIVIGKIMRDYKLFGHCDARPMFESPGKTFYQLIKTWPHYEYMIPIEKLKRQ